MCFCGANNNYFFSVFEEGRSSDNAKYHRKVSHKRPALSYTVLWTVALCISYDWCGKLIYNPDSKRVGGSGYLQTIY